MKTCPDCDLYNMGFPELVQSGRKNPNDLQCLVCDQLFDSKDPRKKLRMNKVKKSSYSYNKEGEDSSNPGSYHF